MTLWQATMMEVDTPGAQSGAQPPLRRVDGRGNDQLRPPGIELGPNNRADGSARVSHVTQQIDDPRYDFMMPIPKELFFPRDGQTSVLAAVYGPGAPRFSRKEKIEGAVLEVICRPHKGQATSADKEKEMFVRSILEEAIIVSQYPRTGIQVIIQVFEDDGGALAAAINAAGLAVLNAGIDMNFVPLATSLAVAEDGTLLLDPTSAEEKAAKATSVMTCSSVDVDGLVSSCTLGPLQPAQLLTCMDLAKGGGQALLALIRRVVAEHTSRTQKD